MKPNTNYDLDLMQVHILALAEMAGTLGKNDEAARWSKMAHSLGPRHVDEENALDVERGRDGGFPASPLFALDVHPPL